MDSGSSKDEGVTSKENKISEEVEQAPFDDSNDADKSSESPTSESNSDKHTETIFTTDIESAYRAE